MPDRIDMEQLVLGAALSDEDAFPQVADLLAENDFSLEKHRRIFVAASEVYGRGEEINAVSVGNELLRKKRLESAGGLYYLSSIADCLPRFYDLARYCELVRAAAVKRQAIASMSALIERCHDPGEDAGNLLAEVERVTELLNSSTNRASVARSTESVVADAGGINVFLSPQTHPGISIPFADIDATLSGLRRSKFILLGARPAVGKTALAVQIAEGAARSGKTVLFVTLEMSAEDVIKRSITGRAAVSAYRFREGRLSPTERDGLHAELADRMELGDQILYVDKSDITVQGIASLLRSLHARGKTVDLCIVDYLQLLSSVGRFETRVQEVSSISRGLKKITQHFGIPLLALSQLTRKEDHRKNDPPALDWLKESGQLEQDADQVLFLWAKKEPEEGDTMREVLWRVAKNRDGVLNQGSLTFHTKYCHFVEDAPASQSAA
ncbi:MAG TPA: DnaB-like helicase C-terminal domain-containing protein [Bryobacteraceae bacterium]|nr:DnaB-like helicase C-terminal domain-containing protein [Bryobacteraceae bacterium]